MTNATANITLSLTDAQIAQMLFAMRSEAYNIRMQAHTAADDGDHASYDYLMSNATILAIVIDQLEEVQAESAAEFFAQFA
jgi:hypothetical protein